MGIAGVDVTYAAVMMTTDRVARFAAAETALNAALSFAPNYAVAHSLLGFVQIATNRAAQGIAACERALALDRNMASAHGWIGMAKLYMGRGAETETHIRQALRLSPRDQFAHRWMHIVGLGKSQLGVDEEAVAWFRRSIENNRNFLLAHFALAGASALIGELAEAKLAAQAGLKLDPSFTISRLRASVSSSNPTFIAGRNRLCEGIRMAGVPEV